MNSESMPGKTTFTEPASAPPPPPSAPRFPVFVVFGVGLIVFVVATLVTFVLPEVFLSKARIKVNRDVSDFKGLAQFTTASGYDPFFIQTEIGVIQSEKVLANVIDRLDLSRQWGKMYMPGGKPFRTSESLWRLKSMLDVRQVPNASLIDIIVCADRPEDAARLANAVAGAYQDYGVRETRLFRQAKMDALEELFLEQSNVVWRAQEKVDVLGKVPENSSKLDDAKLSLEESQRVRSALSAQLLTEKIAIRVPKTPMVEIVDPAYAVYRAVSPNRPLNIFLGVVIGGLLGLSVAAGVHLLQRAAYRRSLNDARSQALPAESNSKTSAAFHCTPSWAMFIDHLILGLYFPNFGNPDETIRNCKSESGDIVLGLALSVLFIFPAWLCGYLACQRRMREEARAADLAMRVAEGARRRAEETARWRARNLPKPDAPPQTASESEPRHSD